MIFVESVGYWSSKLDILFAGHSAHFVRYLFKSGNVSLWNKYIFLFIAHVTIKTLCLYDFRENRIYSLEPTCLIVDSKFADNLLVISIKKSAENNLEY